MPSISVLIRLYNGVEYLGDSLQSVLNQTFTDWELLIGVNGHGDDNNHTYKTARHTIDSICTPEQQTKIRLINYPEVKGGAEAMNALAKDAKAEWIAILDVDDMWDPEKLQLQNSVRDMDLSMPDIIGTRCQYFGAMSGSPITPTGFIDISQFKAGNPMINSSILMKKELLHCTDKFYGMDDYDLWCRLILQGKVFYNLQQILTYHRISPNSHYNASKKQDPDALRRFYFS
jgi:teichuronic acid biosynthesis glycosyltransferase TuaG